MRKIREASPPTSSATPTLHGRRRLASCDEVVLMETGPHSSTRDSLSPIPIPAYVSSHISVAFVSARWSSHLLWSSRDTAYHRQYGQELKGWSYLLHCPSIAIHICRAPHRTNPATALHVVFFRQQLPRGGCLPTPNSYLRGHCCMHWSTLRCRVSDRPVNR